MDRTVNRIIEIYTIISFFVIAFFEIDSAGSVPLKVFHISQTKGYVLLLATIIAYILLTLSGKTLVLKADRVITLLGVKCIFDLIPFILNPGIGDATYWFFFSMVFIAPVVYAIFKCYTGDVNKLAKYTTIFGLILILQEVQTIFANGYPYDSWEYKHFLRIPAAHSNVIGVLLLTILCMRLMQYDGTKVSFIQNALFVIGLFITQSKGSILLLLACFVYIKYKKYNTNNRTSIKYILVFGIALFTILVMNVTAIQLFLFDVTLGNNVTLTMLTSGRTDIWELAWQKFLLNPFCGSGLGVTEYDIGYEIITTGVHNILLDFAVQSGIAGLILYLYAVFYGIVKTKENAYMNSAFRMAILVMFSYSMFEVCYFNYSCLFIFWMFIGLYNRKFN